MPYADPEAGRAFQRELYHTRRATWFRRRGGCKRCGTFEHLQVHHRDPRKKVTHRVFLLRKERRDAELAKCEALCRDCHRLRHHHPEAYHEPPDLFRNNSDNVVAEFLGMETDGLRALWGAKPRRQHWNVMAYK